MPDKKMSLAESIKAKNASLKKNEPEAKVYGAADALSAKKSRIQKKSGSLADRIKAKSGVIGKNPVEKEVDDTPRGEPLSEEDTATVQAAIAELKDRFNDFITRVKLTAIVEEVAELGQDLQELPEGIAQLRQRGYVFHNYLENKLEVLAEQWDAVNDRIETWLDAEDEELEDELAQLEHHMQQFATDSPTTIHQALAEKLGAAFDTFEEKLEAAEAKLQALYQPISTEIYKMQTALRKFTGYMDAAESASFDFRAGEAVFMVAEGEWQDDRDKPDGNVYVTDQRIIFEQDEKTGKRLGMFGGKQTKQVLWEVDHSSVEKVTADNRGMMGGKDMMHLKLGPGADFAEATVEIKGGIEAKEWAQQVTRAVKGLIRDESTVEEDPELIERLSNAPTDCPNCGGVLPKLSAGTTEIECQYCGNVVRA